MKFDKKQIFSQVAVSSMAGNNANLGSVSTNLRAATAVFTGVLTNIFYGIGIVLVVSSIIKYREHRRNASQTPLSSVIVRLLSGLAIGFFPLMLRALSAHTAQYNV